MARDERLLAFVDTGGQPYSVDCSPCLLGASSASAGVIGWTDDRERQAIDRYVATVSPSRPVGFVSTSRQSHADNLCPTLLCGGAASGVIGWTGDATPKHGDDVSPTLRTGQGGEGAGVLAPNLFRRFTATEWERLQGFPDGYTALPGLSDRQRRRMLGNSFAVPVMRWIGGRIKAVEESMTFLD